MLLFGLVTVTDGPYVGKVGRLYSNDNHQAMIIDDCVPSDFIIRMTSVGPDHVEPLSATQPSDAFLFAHSPRLVEIVIDEMKNCINNNIILGRVTALGTLYDALIFKQTGWENAFWNLYVETFAPQQKKRPKSAPFVL